MPITILHLVDKRGDPVKQEIQVAVAAAFKSCVQQFSRIDDAVLAGFAEAVAASMNSRSSEIGTFRNYARVAMNGKVYEWLRSHPGKELGVERFDELERLAGAAVDPSFADAELEILFSQIRTHLSERERHILVLMKQDLGPREISAALGITYDAASKAIQRVRDRVASLLAAPEARRKRGIK
jgi:RNA polymerase sigma factor (sigma-70 family)